MGKVFRKRSLYQVTRSRIASVCLVARRQIVSLALATVFITGCAGSKHPATVPLRIMCLGLKTFHVGSPVELDLALVNTTSSDLFVAAPGLSTDGHAERLNIAWEVKPSQVQTGTEDENNLSRTSWNGYTPTRVYVKLRSSDTGNPDKVPDYSMLPFTCDLRTFDEVGMYTITIRTLIIIFDPIRNREDIVEVSRDLQVEIVQDSPIQESGHEGTDGPRPPDK